MTERDFKDYESRWQRAWEENGVYRAADPEEAENKPKFYGLIEFPYPSGAGLHVGHPRSYTGIDVICRKRRMEGQNVLYPIGWDAFGLPTENYAIKHKVKPQDATAENVATFTRQLKSIGFGFDWSREINTTDPAYYKWTQWQFLKFFHSWYNRDVGRAQSIEELPIPDHVRALGEQEVREYVDAHRMAYKATSEINWCPSCKIGLANEEAAGGVCERCGGKVEKREKRQWMIRITEYAERLLEDLNTVDYLEQIKAQQVNWIGRSEGAYIDFETTGGYTVRVFTTRPDTLFGATYLVLSPEHELVTEWLHAQLIENENEVVDYRKEAAVKTEIERQNAEKAKTGVRLDGVEAKHPVTGESLPVWIADYVLANYGTGAIMAVPAHDERDFAFAKEFDLPIKQVVFASKDYWQKNIFEERIDLEKWLYDTHLHSPETEAAWQGKIDSGYDEYKRRVTEQQGRADSCFVEEGLAINSDFLNDLPTWKAKDDMISWLEEHKKGERAVSYKLRDWVFSRQRYWGEPIPIIHCEHCGMVPAELPVLLPDVENYEPTDSGDSPLAAIRDWVEVTCPSCGGPAERETDTMPNWAGSSWYFLRYTDPHNDHALADPVKLKYWMPVDLYDGGMEHTTLHLLYSRFWHKFLWDIGVVPEECGPEPYRVRRSHGLVMAEGGEKMSKSKGNVVNPDEVVAQYGADVFRVYEMFMGPFDQSVPWDTNGIEGVKRFLDKVWGLYHSTDRDVKADGDLETIYNQTVKKVTDGTEELHFNTCVSQMMILANAFHEAGGIPEDMRDGFLKILAPFAPHMTEEVWHELGNQTSVHVSEWPSYDASKLVADTFELVIQVNGKVRDKQVVASDISEEQAKEAAMASEKVQAFLDGSEPKKVIYIPGKLVNIVV